MLVPGLQATHDTPLKNTHFVCIIGGMKDDTTRARIQVSLSRELLDRIDAYCTRIGVPRSSWIQIALAETLDQKEKDGDQ